MEGLIIFDQSNDIIFRKFNNELHKKLRDLAISQELINNDANDEEDSLNNNVLLQIFSPLINSQKIMFCQFDNTYSNIQCENNLNFVFDEFLGYIFIVIGTESVCKLHRSVGIFILFCKHICGTNIYVLKSNELKSELLSDLIDTWEDLYKNDQATLLEAVEHLIVNTDVKNISTKTLEIATEKLKQDPHSQRSHALIFVDKKFLGLYSSRQSQKLSSCDLLFLSILCKTLQSKMNSSSSASVSSKSSTAINIQSHLYFLQGSSFASTTSLSSSSSIGGGSGGNYVGNNCKSLSGCIPYIVHISILDKNCILYLLIEYGNLNVSNNLYDTFFALQKIQNIQLQGDLENLKIAYDNLELYVKQILESMKKAKFNNSEIDISLKRFNTKWDLLKKRYNEFFKNSEKELIVKIESNIPGILDELKELFRLTCLECPIIDHGFERISEISTLVEEKLLEFSEFLCVKAQQNLSINSYIEEFPGLVHFIFIDRSTGRMMAPDITNGTPIISKEKIWSMIEFSRTYIMKGHSSLIWKDTAFNYSYFLWFEDNNGTSMKPKDLQNYFSSTNVIKPNYEPGILAGDFYQRLIEIYFPKTPVNKVKCYELYCIHLGLVTGTCALEHGRRLVATINDVNAGGIPIQELS